MLILKNTILLKLSLPNRIYNINKRDLKLDLPDIRQKFSTASLGVGRSYFRCFFVQNWAWLIVKLYISLSSKNATIFFS